MPFYFRKNLDFSAKSYYNEMVRLRTKKEQVNETSGNNDTI